MAASDLFMEVGVPGTATTLSAPGWTTGVSTSMTVASTTNWPTGTGVAFAVDRIDSQGVRIAGTYCEFVGQVASATSITGVVKTFGTNQNYAAGATTRVYIAVTSTRENRLAQGMAVQHKQDGTHANVITTNAINENTAGNGVTVDGVLLKDGTVQHTGAVQQVVGTTYASSATGTTVIPLDNTLPQNTEGFEVMTQTVTPKASTNILDISVNLFGGSSVGDDLIVALFKDTGADALAVASIPIGAGGGGQIQLQYRAAAGSTSAQTYKVRFGGSQAGTRTFNGRGGSQLWSTAIKSSIVITEYKA